MYWPIRCLAPDFSLRLMSGQIDVAQRRERGGNPDRSPTDPAVGTTISGKAPEVHLA
jgi:hypothetical protein